VAPSEPRTSLRPLVNGIPADVPGEPGRALLEVLRDELDITGPKLRDLGRVPEDRIPSVAT